MFMQKAYGNLSINNEKVSRKWYLRLANDIGLDNAFFAYQEGQLSKRKLCELIANTIAIELETESKSKII